MTPVNAEVSDCCGAELAVAGRTTQYYICQGCGKPCDAAFGRTRGPVADDDEDLQEA